jgi:UDP-glucose 4-epimerase
MKYLVTGGAGFIGSNLVDSLIQSGNDVIIIDNLISGFESYINPNATFYNYDISNFYDISGCFSNIDGVFHLAAIARTRWCIEDPSLAYRTNVLGTMNVLESCRLHNIKRVIFTSSYSVYSTWSPDRSTKEEGERLANVYNEMYGLSVMSLRCSNVYGKRQSENVPYPSALSCLRKSKRENGYVTITGDGTQSRDFIHVNDVINGLVDAMNVNVTDTVDLSTGNNTSMNEIASFFDCEIKYIPDVSGDVKHIFQNPTPAFSALGWKAYIRIDYGIQDFLNDLSYN